MVVKLIKLIERGEYMTGTHKIELGKLVEAVKNSSDVENLIQKAFKRRKRQRGNDEMSIVFFVLGIITVIIIRILLGI